MSGIEILAVIGVIAYVIFRQVNGEALRGKRAVLLPAVLTVIGYGDLHGNGGGRLSHADVACLVVGAAGSVLIGLAFGWVTRLEERGGYLWAQLPVWGLWLWGALIAWRVLVMVVAGAVHAHVAASSATLLFSLGVNRLAQAAVIVPRAMAMGVPFAPEKDGRVFMADGFARRSGAGPWQQGSNTPPDTEPRRGRQDPWDPRERQDRRDLRDLQGQRDRWDRQDRWDPRDRHDQRDPQDSPAYSPQDREPWNRP